ncbi:hypothetical protein BUALT_Bualt02G0212300 [Buddleja alternifolia]|uniref:Uncharacterized protein n=1 Tax=Buddleja alternifolia TaxID=168488 RepID=A0AAV6Y481_9LAMI|nr:hypothetical protein BUALT_Bualt02G0212300 [Buddleja alternifolia]
MNANDHPDIVSFFRFSTTCVSRLLQMSNEAEKEPHQVENTQESTNQPIIQDNVPTNFVSTDVQARYRNDGKKGHKALKITAEPSISASRKRITQEETSGTNAENQSEQGYTSLRMRADNHPAVLCEKKSKSGKTNRSTEAT